jgi:hypothetical protein
VSNANLEEAACGLAGTFPFTRTPPRLTRLAEPLPKGWKDVPVWVFCNEEGRPIWKSDFERRVFHKALDKAQLRRIRFHDLRHTFASRLLQNQESIVYVKDQLGHHSIKVTVDVYGHLVPGGEQGGRRSPGRAGPDGLRGTQPDATPAQPGALRTHARGYGLRRNPARRFGGAEGART